MHGRHTWRGVGGLDLGLVKVVKVPTQNTHTSTHIFHETFREPLAHPKIVNISISTTVSGSNLKSMMMMMMGWLKGFAGIGLNFVPRTEWQ